MSNGAQAEGELNATVTDRGVLRAYQHKPVDRLTTKTYNWWIKEVYYVGRGPNTKVLSEIPSQAGTKKSPFRALAEFIYVSAVQNVERDPDIEYLERLELLDDDPDRVPDADINDCLICSACGKKFETERLSLEHVNTWIAHKLNCDRLQSRLHDAFLAIGAPAAARP